MYGGISSPRIYLTSYKLLPPPCPAFSPKSHIYIGLSQLHLPTAFHSLSSYVFHPPSRTSAQLPGPPVSKTIDQYWACKAGFLAGDSRGAYPKDVANLHPSLTSRSRRPRRGVICVRGNMHYLHSLVPGRALLHSYPPVAYLRLSLLPPYWSQREIPWLLSYYICVFFFLDRENDSGRRK